MIGPELLGRLFDEHGAALVLYARQWSEAPEDVVQEAFIALARLRAEPDHVAAWLFRAVRNRAISCGRSARRRRHREARAARDESWFSSLDDRLDAGRAAALLAELEPRTREVIVARIWGGLTLGEVAGLLGCSITTAHRRYRAGLSLLLDRLEGQGPCPTEMTDQAPTNR
ncbi:RNA polymerase sigma factor [Tautonia plasticadhaerens]|uniref:RNA polymerase sigma factor CnrH n=1 Tax=Tautonia plasticadhaerens TaxID=2527974 RepID=A0A518HD32_9BACT|nr:sigma-70 family RNA polymerase sigma factor [Tautonia plasticadhaerens]QDV38769.1 RNA polymerase sigma factor CnrH [Tautonia plasticadhaerens]